MAQRAEKTALQAAPPAAQSVAAPPAAQRRLPVRAACSSSTFPSRSPPFVQLSERSDPRLIFKRRWALENELQSETEAEDYEIIRLCPAKILRNTGMTCRNVRRIALLFWLRSWERRTDGGEREESGPNSSCTKLADAAEVRAAAWQIRDNSSEKKNWTRARCEQ
jgi:hypothetical protein